MRENQTQTVDQLNSFLRGELAAVETYRQVLEKITNNVTATDLKECMSSHRQRADWLRSRIVQLGGEAVTESGAWGMLLKLMEGGASLFGEKAAVSALEQGEDFGMKDYTGDLTQLDPESRHLVQSKLLPEQQQTHRAVSSLKHKMSS